MKTLDARFPFILVGAWLIGMYMGLPFPLALLVVWKGITGTGNEGIFWGLIIGALLGALIWPHFVWWPLMMGATGLLLYLLRKYFIRKLTPVSITFFTLFSLFFWHICLAAVQSRFSLGAFFAIALFDAFIACILINLCYAIFHQKKGTHQLRLWERSFRGIIRSVR